MAWGLARISSKEITEWQAFFQLEPQGAIWENLLAAMQMTLLANVNRDPKKKQTPFVPADFMVVDLLNGDEEKTSVMEKFKGMVG